MARSKLSLMACLTNAFQGQAFHAIKDSFDLAISYQPEASENLSF
jgi:hypothetical protein